MKVVIVGGKLQGVEASYLAHNAGWDVILVDKYHTVPAVGLADEFYQLDVISDQGKLAEVIRNVDFVLPALEDIDSLRVLDKIASRRDVPFAYCDSSYLISSSKKKSDDLFKEEGIPAPNYWPHCEFPVIAKPSGLSGSHGVKRIMTQGDLKVLYNELGTELNNWIIQEYLEGPSFSIEVFGFQGSCKSLQVTDLEMDHIFDCKRVQAPTVLSAEVIKQFAELATQIGQLIGLTGIMDVEVIYHIGILKVLEIDARLPSQTPTVVYKSSGINMFSELYSVFTKGELKSPTVSGRTEKSSVIYEHILVERERIITLGEHIMAKAGPLTHYKDFFGADEAITNYQPGRSFWVATLVITDTSKEMVWKKRCEVIENIKQQFNISQYIDSTVLNNDFGGRSNEPRGFGKTVLPKTRKLFSSDG